jgi:hypothetical protein
LKEARAHDHLCGFLEGAVGWASQLFGDLIEHWERRSAEALERMHPDKLDRARLMSLVEKYGYSDIATALRQRGGLPDPEQAYLTGNVENIDDFTGVITSQQGVVQRPAGDPSTLWLRIVFLARIAGRAVSALQDLRSRGVGWVEALQRKFR